MAKFHAIGQIIFICSSLFTSQSFTTHYRNILDTSLKEHITILRQSILNHKTPPTLETAVFKYLFASDPLYAQDFANRFNDIMSVFYDLVENDICKQTNACLLLPHLHLEEPYHHTLEKVIHELIPLYYDTDGTLITTNPPDHTSRNFSIAQFLKNGIDQEHYKTLLREFNFQDVIAHENQTSTYLVNNIYHVATGGWLPSLTWYPENIKMLIKNNTDNHMIEIILDDCCDYNFAAAYTMVHSNDNPISHQIYTQKYNTFKKHYCNEHGVLTAYDNDPLWSLKSDDEKLVYAQDIYILTQLNEKLYKRAQQKNRLHNTWNISFDAPFCVHNALYDLIDILETSTLCIAKITDIITQHTDPERQALIEAFYMPHGILKYLTHIPEAHAFIFPSTIFSQHDILQEINELVYIQHACAGTQEGALARLQLAQLQAQYDPALTQELISINYDVLNKQHHTLLERIRTKIKEITGDISHYTKTTCTSIKNAIVYVTYLCKSCIFS